MIEAAKSQAGFNRPDQNPKAMKVHLPCNVNLGDHSFPPGEAEVPEALLPRINAALRAARYPAAKIISSAPDKDNGTDGINATDGAIALAEAEGVDLALVEGTGAGGRIIKADVTAYLVSLDDPSGNDPSE